MSRSSLSRPQSSVGIRVCLVAAMATNRVIGSSGALPWKIPDDLRRFKALTLGHPIIMGRRTWESIGRPLPGRDNIVVSRQAAYVACGGLVVPDLETAFELCHGHKIAFVIGGADLFKVTLGYADALALTEIHRDYPGDAFFPHYDKKEWRESSREPRVDPDGLRFDFVIYERAFKKH